MQESANLTLKSQIMSSAEFERALKRIAHEVIERNKGAGDVALVGIHTRGVPLAERLAGLVEMFEGTRPPVGKLDITLYRDDLTEIALQPIVRRTEVEFDRSEEHTSELQSRENLVCRLLLEKKKT